MLLKRKRNKKNDNGIKFKDNGIKFKDGNNISFKKPSEIKFRAGGYYDYLKSRSNPVNTENNYNESSEEDYSNYNEEQEN